MDNDIEKPKKQFAYQLTRAGEETRALADRYFVKLKWKCLQSSEALLGFYENRRLPADYGKACRFAWEDNGGEWPDFDPSSSLLWILVSRDVPTQGVLS